MMVKNLGSGSSEPNFLTNFNGTLIFAAYTSATGRELWRSDGTAAGTVMIKDIRPGSGHSIEYTNVNNFLVIGNTLYFSANDGVNGIELWKTDGTTSGTVMVKDINPGSNGGLNVSNNRNFTDVNGTLFFYATDNLNGTELWKSDGTTAGTVLVKDIRPGTIGSTPGLLTSFQGQLYFEAHDGTGGYDLWKSDGTAGGTSLVIDKMDPAGMVVMNGDLYFTTSTSALGNELWKFDGTVNGLEKITSRERVTIYPNPSSGMITLGSLPCGQASVQVTDMQGRIVYEAENFQAANGSINLSDVEDGVYTLQVKCGEAVRYASVCMARY
jgi:ELWxxDGT repeat protein